MVPGICTSQLRILSTEPDSYPNVMVHQGIKSVLLLQIRLQVIISTIQLPAVLQWLSGSMNNVAYIPRPGYLLAWQHDENQHAIGFSVPVTGDYHISNAPCRVPGKSKHQWSKLVPISSTGGTTSTAGEQTACRKATPIQVHTLRVSRMLLSKSNRKHRSGKMSRPWASEHPSTMVHATLYQYRQLPCLYQYK